MQCGAILDIIALLDAPLAADRADAKELIVRIVSMRLKCVVDNGTEHEDVHARVDGELDVDGGHLVVEH